MFAGALSLAWGLSTIRISLHDVRQIKPAIPVANGEIRPLTLQLPTVEVKRRKYEQRPSDHRSAHQSYLAFLEKHGGRTMPETMFGKPLAYEYKDVPLFIPADARPLLDDIMEWESLACEIMPPMENDPKPVAVRLDRWENGKVVNNRIIGYIQDNSLRDMVRDYISKDRIYLVRTQRIDNDAGIVYIHLAFYQKRNQSTRQIFRLVYNAGDAIQKNIAACNAGDEVSIEYSSDNRWIAVCNGHTVGYFPKHATYIVQDHPQSWVDRVERDGDGRYTIYVICFEK